MFNLKKRVRALTRTVDINSLEFYNEMLDLKEIAQGKEKKRIYDVFLILYMVVGFSLYYFLREYLQEWDAYVLILFVGFSLLIILSGDVMFHRRLLKKIIFGEFSVEELRKLKGEM